MATPSGQSSPKEEPASLSKAFNEGPVNFKGRKIVKEDRYQPKKEVDTAELRKILEESLKK